MLSLSDGLDDTYDVKTPHTKKGWCTPEAQLLVNRPRTSSGTAFLGHVFNTLVLIGRLDLRGQLGTMKGNIYSGQTMCRSSATHASMPCAADMGWCLGEVTFATKLKSTLAGPGMS